METKAEKSKKKRKTKKRKKGDMNNVCLSSVASQQCTVTLDPIIMLPHLLERIQLIRFVFSTIPSPFSTWIEFSIQKITLQIFGDLNGLFFAMGGGCQIQSILLQIFDHLKTFFPLLTSFNFFE